MSQPPYEALSRSIKGKTALITCAASGMGRATAHLFAREGANVAVTDLKQENVDKVKVSLNPGLYVGFGCIFANCAILVATGLLCRGKLPKNFAMFSLALYGFYLALSLGLLLSAGA